MRLLIACCLVSLLAISGCSGFVPDRGQVAETATALPTNTPEAHAYFKANRTNTVAAYEGFLKEYPAGAYATKAKEAIHLLCPIYDKVSELAPVLQGRGVPQARPFAATPGLHPVVLLTDRGTLHDWHHEMPAEWRAPSLEAAELVVVIRPPTKKVLEVREYTGDAGDKAPSITRYRNQLPVSLRATQSGKELENRTIFRDPRLAGDRERYDLTTLSVPVSRGDLFNWLRTHVLKPLPEEMTAAGSRSVIGTGADGKLRHYPGAWLEYQGEQPDLLYPGSLFFVAEGGASLAGSKLEPGKIYLMDAGRAHDTERGRYAVWLILDGAVPIHAAPNTQGKALHELQAGDRVQLLAAGKDPQGAHKVRTGGSQPVEGWVTTKGHWKKTCFIDVKPFQRRGAAYLAQKDHAGAIAEFSKGLEWNRDNALLYNERAVAHTWLDGGDESALADFAKAIALDAKFAIAYRNRAATYLRLGRLKEALADVDECIKLDPTYGRAYKTRGDVLTRLGKAAEAKADYEEAKRLAK